MINILLCGGSGTRLWPVSRKLFPKQFVDLFKGKSLFQKTVERNSLVSDSFIVVSNSEQFFLAQNQFVDVVDVVDDRVEFLLEPVARNTAPAIALACMGVDPEEIMMVTPTDHMIKDEEGYRKLISRSEALAREGYLVTFGINPSYPEVGFGYIEADGEDVVSFKEKPSLDIAEAYLASGNYYWNSGIFTFKAGVFLSELKSLAPEIYTACLAAFESKKSDNSVSRISLEDMLRIPEESVDFAVMEKSSRIKVVSSDINWSDLGSFDALSEEFEADENENVVLRRGDSQLPVVALNSKNNFIITRNHAVAVVDVDDLVVVDTTDAVLISKKGSSQKVKEVLAIIKKEQPELSEVHRIAYRPWGSYEILSEASTYKIKRIIVSPGKRLSLQKHFHRSEHWVVVSGTAEVQIGDEIKVVRPNESVYISMGDVHRLSNNGKIDVVMIEVQVGSYLGEDDIIRLEDDFKRL